MTLLTEDGVPGYINKLQRDDHLSSGRVTPKSEITTLRFVSEPTNVNFTVDEVVTSTIQTFLPARLNSHFLQQQQIQALKEKKSYLVNTTLNNNFPGKINRRNVVISRKKMRYHRVGTGSSKASPPDILQEPKLHFSSHTIVQHSGFDIFRKKMGEER